MQGVFWNVSIYKPPTLCLASSISQACRSMLIGRQPCSCSAVRESHVCSSSSVFWNWPRPSRAHSSWCWWHHRDKVKLILCWFSVYQYYMMKSACIFSPVCWQSLTPSCPSAAWSHTAVRPSLAALSLETAGTQSDGSGFLSLFSSGKVPA